MSKEKKILVTGSHGQLGREFMAVAAAFPAFQFVFTTRAELDIRLQHHALEMLNELKPAAVINCAAYTNVELAETEQEEAYEGNALGAKYLAEACGACDALLIHFSTDYVFDGKKKSAYRETDNANPLNVYGETKLQGERFIDEILRRYFIIRASWLYSTYGHNFYKTMLRLAQERGELHVVNDQVASPTYARTLAQDVMKLLTKTILKQEHTNYGLYHYAQHGEASWHRFASDIVRQHNIDVKVHAVGTTHFHTRAVRPTYSKLNAAKFESLLGHPLNSWEEGLAACIAEEY
ncbi:MAG: dTDP-4-dehydrorhamnose reductase [Flavobacteriales bacterium]